MKYAYYPGCAATGSTPELDIATRRIANKLGVELVELKEAGCCGAKEIGVVSSKLNLVLNKCLWITIGRIPEMHSQGRSGSPAAFCRDIPKGA